MLLPNNRLSTRMPHALVAALLLVFGVAAFIPAANAQSPVFSLTYSAKYVCGILTPPDFPSLGTSTTEMVTVVEVHNPNSTSVDIVIKVIQDFPLPGGISSGPTTITLGPNAAREFNCQDFLALPGTVAPYRKGFFEIKSPRPLKVVSLYKEFNRNTALQIAVALAKKSCPYFLFPPGQPPTSVRYSGALFCGDQASAREDTTSNETSIAISNVSDSPIDIQRTAAAEGRPPNNFTRHLDPRGFISIHCDMLPAGALEGTLLITHVGSAALLECEEIIKGAVKWSNVSVTSDMSVVEVQPVPAK